MLVDRALAVTTDEAAELLTRALDDIASILRNVGATVFDQMPADDD